jgi:CheY-like chemotaxis protein
MKILVIEDQPVELKLVNHVLSNAGHEVSGAEAAEQAFAAVKANHPELILLDLILPGMDGLAVVRKLKADPDTCDIPVVAVTSCPEAYPKTAAMNAGCDAYLLKPVNTRQLSDQLAEIVREKNDSDQKEKSREDFHR